MALRSAVGFYIGWPLPSNRTLRSPGVAEVHDLRVAIRRFTYALLFFKLCFRVKWVFSELWQHGPQRHHSPEHVDLSKRKQCVATADEHRRVVLNEALRWFGGFKY